MDARPDHFLNVIHYEVSFPTMSLTFFLIYVCLATSIFCYGLYTLYLIVHFQQVVDVDTNALLHSYSIAQNCILDVRT